MRKKYIYYNITMAILSLAVAIILILELTLDLNKKTLNIFYRIDFFIWIIFVIDYFKRLYKSRNKKKFIKRHIIDLISIIPLYTIFTIFRTLNILKISRVSRIANLSKVIRIFGVFKISKENLEIFINTNNFNYTLLIALIVIVGSSTMLSLIEKISFFDSLWWSIVTVTTVGYGDIYPKTLPGKIVATILMFTGIGLIGSLTSTISTYFINKEKNEKSKDIKVEKDNYKSKVINEAINSLRDFDNISKNDLKNIFEVLNTIKDK